MADFTQVMTGAADISDASIELMDQQFYVASGEMGITDQFVTYRQEINATSIDFDRFERLSLATTPLVDKEDPVSEQMSVSKVTLTPAEYGNVVTTTKLANLQTGGKADIAAARIVGINAGETLDKLAILAGEESVNVLYKGQDSEALIEATDTMDVTFLNTMYNKLARKNVIKLDGGFYVAQMHDDCIHDLRASASAGSWVDINKYSNPEDVMKNEVGTLGGFRIVRNNNATINADAGLVNVDTYKSLFMGYNALGKAESSPLMQKITGPFDKLARFLNIGFHWVGQYKIVDADAIYLGYSASSVGDNA